MDILRKKHSVFIVSILLNNLYSETQLNLKPPKYLKKFHQQLVKVFSDIYSSKTFKGWTVWEDNFLLFYLEQLKKAYRKKGTPREKSINEFIYYFEKNKRILSPMEKRGLHDIKPTSGPCSRSTDELAIKRASEVFNIGIRHIRKISKKYGGIRGTFQQINSYYGYEINNGELILYTLNKIFNVRKKELLLIRSILKKNGYFSKASIASSGSKAIKKAKTLGYTTMSDLSEI